MENTEKFRWAFIGSGGIAQKVAKQIIASKRHEIVSVYSRNIKNASKLASGVGAQAFETVEEAVKRDNVDGVYVCSTNNAHYANAEAAMKTGKPVLLEKPFTLNSGDAEKLFKTASREKVYLAEAMWTWYGPVARKVKEWVDGGKIGKLLRIEYQFELNLLMFKKLKARLLDPSPGGGSLYDLGVYPLTYAYRLLGMPRDMRCANRYSGTVDVGNEIVLNYYGGAECHIKVAVDRLGGEKAVITGEKGRITVPNAHAAKKAVLETDKKVTFRGDSSYLPEFDEAAREIRQGLLASELVPPDATVDVLRMIDTLKAIGN